MKTEVKPSRTHPTDPPTPIPSDANRKINCAICSSLSKGDYDIGQIFSVVARITDIGKDSNSRYSMRITDGTAQLMVHYVVGLGGPSAWIHNLQ